MNRIFTIRVSDIDKIETLIKRINKKAKTHGVLGAKVTVLDETQRVKEAKVFEDSDYLWYNRKVVVPVVDVLVEGNIPVTKGHSFVASVEATENGNIIFGGGEYDLSKYRTGGIYCEHCNAKRNRKKGIIVRKPDGSLIQVGRSCVKDFLGDDFDAKLSALENIVVKIGSISDDIDNIGGGFVPDAWSIESFLAITACEIRTNGWRSSTTAREYGSVSTKDAVLNDLNSKKGQKLIPEDEDVEVAKKTLEWILSVTPDSDFLHSAQVIAKGGFVTYKTAGFVAAIIKAYETHVNKIAAKDNQVDFTKSQFVGTVGKRIETRVRVISKKVIESYYGVNTVITFVTPEGNILTTFASGSVSSVERNEETTIKGTVKKHNIFRDSNQTILNRVVLV